MCSCVPATKIYGDVVMVASDRPPLESRSAPSALTPNARGRPPRFVVDPPQTTTRIAPARGTDRLKAAVAKAARWAPSPAGLSRFGADLEGVPGNARNRLAALQVPTTSIYTRNLLRLQPDPAPPSCTTAKLLTYYVRTVRRHSPCSGSTCSSSSRSSSSGQDLEASESVSPAGQVCSYWPQRGCTPTPPRPFRGRSSGSS